jgi:protein-S-isoprenylcysteine O-methyltransferase Ste14
MPNGPDAHRVSKLYVVTQHVLLILFVAIAFLAPRHFLFESRTVRTIGSVVGISGVVLILVAAFTLRRVIQIAPQPKAGGELIQDGIYRYLRHPIYTGMLFCVAGLFLRMPTIWIGLATVVVTVFLFIKARFEEKLLLIAYAEYKDYRQRTWGLIPGLR